MKQASLFAWKLLLCLPLTDNDKHIFEEDIVLLAKICTNGMTTFSAAGFYNVDFGVIFSMLSFISGFVILSMQIFTSVTFTADLQNKTLA